jgi:hypothetical protein
MEFLLLSVGVLPASSTPSPAGNAPHVLWACWRRTSRRWPPTRRAPSRSFQIVRILLGIPPFGRRNAATSFGSRCRVSGGVVGALLVVRSGDRRLQPSRPLALVRRRRPLVAKTLRRWSMRHAKTPRTGPPSSQRFGVPSCNFRLRSTAVFRRRDRHPHARDHGFHGAKPIFTP